MVSLARALMEHDRFLVPARAFYQARNLFQEYVRNSVSVGRYFGSNMLKKSLSALAKNDPDAKYLARVPDELTGKRLVHKDKIKGLVEGYIIGPCKIYANSLGPDLFVPARFDALFKPELNEADVCY